MKKTILIILLIMTVLVLFVGLFYLYGSKTKQNVSNEKDFGTYSKIGSNVSVVNGKLAFEAETLTGDEIIIYDGKEYGAEYDKVYKPQEIGGKLTYGAYNKKDSEIIYYIVYGDRVYTDTNDYYNISRPVDINGKMAFEAYVGGTKAQRNGKSIIIYDGKKYGEQYAWASEIFNVNGKLGYIAKEGIGLGKTFLVVDGQEIGKEYNQVSHPVVINGKLAFSANKKVGNAWESFFVYADKEYNISITDEGERDEAIVEINKKPAFPSGDGATSFIYYDGQKIKPNKQRTNDSSFTPRYSGIKEIEKKMAFEVKYEFCCPAMGENPSIEGFVYYDGKEYGLEYDSARSPFEVNGKLGYIAKKNNKEFVIINGNIITEEYNAIAFVKVINNKLFYAAKKGMSYSIYKY